MSCASCKVNSVSNIVGFPAAYSFFILEARNGWETYLSLPSLLSYPSPLLFLSFYHLILLPSFFAWIFGSNYLTVDQVTSPRYGDRRRVTLLPFYLNFDPKKAFSFLLPSPYSCSPLDISSQIQPHSYLPSRLLFYPDPAFVTSLPVFFSGSGQFYLTPHLRNDPPLCFPP